MRLSSILLCSHGRCTIVFFHNKDVSPRMFINYRQFNKITIKKYPLLRIDDLLDKMKGAMFLSIINLQSRQHQLMTWEEDIPKTAFQTRKRHFVFLVILVGFTNTLAALMDLINKVIDHFIDLLVIIFIDNILVCSMIEVDHAKSLHIELQTLKQQ